MDFESVAAQATEQFHDCRKLLIALGNETRQAIITTLIEDECKGMRVGDALVPSRRVPPSKSPA